MSRAIEVWTLLFSSWSFAYAQGPTPMVKSQPGFYRMMLGDVEITALNDGVIEYSTKTLIGATAEQIRAGMAESGLSGPVGMSYNAFLINTGSKLVLIDTGTGGKLDDNPGFHGAGHLMRNLRAAGYRPEQVDEIYITHMGPDHVGGLTIDNDRAFPNALVRISQRELDAFLKPPSDAASASSQAKFWIDFRTALFAPYRKAGKLATFTEDGALASGIRSLGTPGHTPGHTSYVVESGGQTLIVLGDLVHWAAVQFPFPGAHTSFDTDPQAASVQRIRIFELASERKYWVAGAHLAFPGIGHLRAASGRFFWNPALYAIP